MAATEIFQTIAKIWLAFVGFICSLFSKSSKHEDDAKPPILPLTANKPVANHGAPELVRTHMYIEDAASPRNFVAAGMMPYYEDDTERFIRDIPIPQSPMDYHPTPYAGSPNPLSKSAITSLYTSFAATKSDLSTPQSFGASKDTRPDITQADCGPATLLDRSPQVQEIVLDLKHATLVNFDHWVFRDSEDVDAGLVESKEGTHCAGASSCETSLADNDSTEAIEPRPSTDKLKKCSDSVSRDVIVDFACLSTYPISALSASSTCAFSDIPPSGDNSAGAECVPLPIANTASCHWTSDIPLSPEQQCKGRISLTPYPEGLSMTIDFGSPELANLKATLEAIKLLDDPPTGIDQLSDDSSMATEILSNTIVVRVEEPLAVDPSSMAAEANGDKIHFEALPPVSVFLQAIPTPDPDPTWIADHRPGKENEATTTPDVPRDKIPAEDKAKRKPLSTVAIGSTADKADIRDRDRYRGAAYSRVLPKPCLSASSSMTSVALASVPQLTSSPVLQNSGTPPLLSGVFIPSTNSTASQGQSKPSENRVVRNMTGTPRGVSFDSKDINVRQDDGTVCSNGKARRRKSILQCSTPDSNVKHGVRVAKGNLHEKSKSLSKSTGCQVKASTSGGLVK